jgi:3-hydroxymyristoyl/3-hydroxydecanoyl-(acyl carrier protein) dehydratase
MRDGAAGFFTEAELEAGRGIVAADLERGAGATGSGLDGTRFVEVAGVEAYDAAGLEALREGDLAGCFGPTFTAIRRTAHFRPLTIPGGRIGVIDRVVRLEPHGGRYGRGFVRAEQDVAPDAWYLTCHFVDDMVMPGTLMYECSLHTLRVFLLRLGWIGEEERVAWAPVPGVAARLKCRGQVIRTTRVAAYEVHVKELGFRPEPYAIADTVMIADGKPIVHITDMNVRLTGIDRHQLEARWQNRQGHREPRPSLFRHEQILAFATGKPSEAYGERYRIFDDGRRFIARLPAPPFNFLHRIVRIEGAGAWQLRPGGTAVAEYDVPPDAWYFAADRQRRMPYAVLLEVALQACGWLAAYLGSALVSEVDLRFRNLGGEARPDTPIRPDAGTLTTTVTITDVSRSGDMILQRFDFRIENRGRCVFEGKTYFGFFSEAALAGQVGIRDSDPWRPDPAESAAAEAFAFPAGAPFPDAQLRMVDRIDCYLPRGGPEGLGFIRGTTRVDPDAWFFKAHFLGDPVWPGSLGLESLIQLLKTVAAKRWNLAPDTEFEAALLGKRHRWVYRGQVVPADHEVTVEATVTRIEDGSRLILADGYLMIDGRTIYQMSDFGLRAVSGDLAKR